MFLYITHLMFSANKLKLSLMHAIQRGCVRMNAAASFKYIRCARAHTPIHAFVCVWLQVWKVAHTPQQPLLSPPKSASTPGMHVKCTPNGSDSPTIRITLLTMYLWYI